MAKKTKIFRVNSKDMSQLIKFVIKTAQQTRKEILKEQNIDIELGSMVGLIADQLEKAIQDPKAWNKKLELLK